MQPWGFIQIVGSTPLCLFLSFPEKEPFVRQPHILTKGLVDVLHWDVLHGCNAQLVLDVPPLNVSVCWIHDLLTRFFLQNNKHNKFVLSYKLWPKWTFRKASQYLHNPDISSPVSNTSFHHLNSPRSSSFCSKASARPRLMVTFGGRLRWTTGMNHRCELVNMSHIYICIEAI